MRTITIALLEQLRKVVDFTSNREIARVLKVSPGTVSSYRNSHSRMSELVALRAAALLGRAPHVSLVKLAAERTKDTQIARMWRRVARDVAQRFGEL